MCLYVCKIDHHLIFIHQIAGVALEPNDIVRRDGMVHVASPHPPAHGLTTAFCMDLGRRLAKAGRPIGFQWQRILRTTETMARRRVCAGIE
jgi:hypothetical protein